MYTHFGPFELSNFGDTLYGLLLSKILGKPTNLVGVTGKPDKSFVTYDTTPITELDLSQNVIVGGGDILREDTGAIRDHYKIDRWPHFLQHTFGVPNAHFISCGVPFPIKKFNVPYKSLWVRDHQSADNLGVPAHVAPDLAVLTSDCFPFDKPKGDYIVLQTNREGERAHQLIQKLRRENVILVSGQRYVDDQRRIRSLGSMYKIPTMFPNTLETVALIAGAKMVISSAMHFAIVAYSYGVPFAMIPLPMTYKQAGFLDVVGEPSYRLLHDLNYIQEAKQPLSPQAIEVAKNRVRSAIKMLADNLTSSSDDTVSSTGKQEADSLGVDGNEDRGRCGSPSADKADDSVVAA